MLIVINLANRPRFFIRVAIVGLTIGLAIDRTVLIGTYIAVAFYELSL